MGHVTRPVRLSAPNKLVLLPHTYGHGTQPYMSEPHFPRNMPAVWDHLWGRIAQETGTPVRPVALDWHYQRRHANPQHPLA
jgi:hypothetical protein